MKARKSMHRSMNAMVGQNSRNPLPDNKILDWSIVFADDKIQKKTYYDTFCL